LIAAVIEESLQAVLEEPVAASGAPLQVVVRLPELTAPEQCSELVLDAFTFRFKTELVPRVSDPIQTDT
jgi:hypothetical protein